MREAETRVAVTTETVTRPWSWPVSVWVSCEPAWRLDRGLAPNKTFCNLPATTTTSLLVLFRVKTSATTAPLLVTGASGQLGKLVVHHLLTTLQVSPERIIAGTRDPAKLQDLADKGVQVRKIDFSDPPTVTAAAAGVERVLLISSDDLVNREAGQKAAVEALVDAGVKHIAYTSLQALDKTLFTSGQWYSAAKDGKVSLVARDDFARAATYVLASGSIESRVYELTGSEALTVDEIVAQISEAVEKPIQVVQVSVPDFAQGIVAATGYPQVIADILASVDASTAAGVAGDVTDDYEKLTGVKPQTHREWLEANKTFLKSL
ncbi:hypothetical protein Poli38472_012650 [Pythium oligandrum]|uniref:NAD(P)-binding domain-containing protein n=1 Tax=Pythium oligandrum TaxID=41045 RepID=A0A8K1CEA6_PYTOL|nr:hypothetical protein Poli38472_012650 [Pythium oligandrum]|eukprot:TMW61459.1 hypothetical protein Poli38472_012650 [Pythium oligandrum]